MENSAAVQHLESKLHERAVNTTRHLAAFAIQDTPKPLPESLFSSALGLMIYPKIAETLQGKDSGLKIQALSVCIELLHKQENHVHVIQNGVLTELVLSLEDSNVSVSRLASQAIMFLSRSRYGREYILRAELLDRLTALVTPSETAVDPEAKLAASSLHTEQKEFSHPDLEKAQARIHMHCAFSHLADTPSGCAALLKFGLEEKLTSCLEAEPFDHVKAPLVDVLLYLLRRPIVGPSSLRSRLVTALIASIGEQTCEATNIACCKLIAQLALTLDGKAECVKLGAIPSLILLTENQASPSVQAQAANALGNITVNQSGKEQCVEMQGVKRLLALVLDEKTAGRVLSPVLHLLSNICEVPSARAEAAAALADNASALRIMKLTGKETPSPALESQPAKPISFAHVNKEAELVQRASLLFLEQIRWKP